MIILDYNAIAYANICVCQCDIELGMIRHMILNTIRSYNKKYREEYGRMVIATDSCHVWRKDIFDLYKYQRKVKRDEDKEKTKQIFNILGTVREELKLNFPQYTFIIVDKAEADDIIGTLCATQYRNEKIMIVSPDKDFLQLQKYDGVKQFSSITKKPISPYPLSPSEYLFEHIMRGDSGDGVPNARSVDDIFTQTGKRQKPVTKKLLSAIYPVWYSGDKDNIEKSLIENDIDPQNYYRNKKMIDLSNTPDHIRDEILAQFNNDNNTNNTIKKSASSLLNYLIKNKCGELIKVADDFDNKYTNNHHPKNTPINKFMIV